MRRARRSDIRAATLAPVLALATCLALPAGAADASDTSRAPPSLLAEIVPPPDAPRPAQQFGIEGFAGTWCYTDGVKSHYTVVAPGRLRLTRLTPGRIHLYGQTYEFPVRAIGNNRFQWGYDDREDYFVVRIDGASSFSAIEYYYFDRATKTHIRSPYDPAEVARRCDGELSRIGGTGRLSIPHPFRIDAGTGRKARPASPFRGAAPILCSAT